jgi:hypothetical protein
MPVETSTAAGFDINAVSMRACPTPKAFANFSPGLLQPWGTTRNQKLNAEGVGKIERYAAFTLRYDCLPVLLVGFGPVFGGDEGAAVVDQENRSYR